MEDKFNNNEEQTTQEAEGNQAGTPEVMPNESEGVINNNPNYAPKKELSKKTLGILGVIAVIIVVAIIIFTPSKFDKVRDECCSIAGTIGTGDDYFIIETIPDSWDSMDPIVRMLSLKDHESAALEAIRYANRELGFSSSVYSDMLSTSAIMGRQNAENRKYKVMWTYHPDDGLTVKYIKK